MNAKFLNAATNAAIELAKLAATLPYDSASAVDSSWGTVRDVFVKQVPAAQQQGLRRDLEELYQNTKLHSRTVVADHVSAATRVR